MKLSVEESGDIERKLTVSVPRDEVDSAIEKRLRAVAARARIPGFRPGKAPREMIARRYGAEVTREVVNDTIESSYREAIKREEILPASVLSIEPKPFEDGGDLQYVATIELFPNIPSPTLAGRKFEKPVCEVGPDDIDRALQSIRKRNAEFNAKTAKAASGDRLTIDFTGAINGEEFPGGSAEGHQFILGDGHAVDAFDTLSGVRTGDTREVTQDFPAEYPAEELAGKSAKFAITVRAVESPSLPALNTAFAEKLGITEGGMAKMREEIATSLRRELQAKMRAVLRDRVMSALLEANPITPPAALVAREVERRAREYEERVKAAGGAADTAAETETERAQFKEPARRNVTLSLIAAEVIEQSNLQPDRELIHARLKEMARDYDDAEKMIEWYQSDPARMRHIEELALEEQMVARMIESADVTEKRVSFKDFMLLGMDGLDGRTGNAA